MPLAAGALVSLIFAALLAWYVARPIRNLRAAFEAAADGRLEQRLAPAMGRRRDELSDLGRDFDRMASRLKSLMDSQRRLLHDVSHELRSPLARLQAAIGLVRQQPERIEDFVARIERESGRMDTLVSELLTLSRLEAGMAGKLDETVDLGELLADVVDDARFEAVARNCQVEFNGSEVAGIQGNAELLHRAIENIVRNAVKHAPPGSRVEIDVAQSDDRVIVRVVDAGPGVDDADLQSIFAPFFRSGTGKSKNHQDGHGLGLAISQRVVEAHRGTIAAANRPSGGLCVTVSLPR
jgi:two-component system, OmpR family, sensor kinase